MPKWPSPNSPKPWTFVETRALRRLASAGVPRREIARELGRSPDAVASHLSKVGIEMEPPCGGRMEPRPAVLPLDAGEDPSGPVCSGGVRSSSRGKPPNRFRPTAPGGDAAAAEFRLKVVRLARPARPWIWEIRREGDAAARECSTLGYRSAEDAWVAGKAILAGYRRRGDL